MELIVLMFFLRAKHRIYVRPYSTLHTPHIRVSTRAPASDRGRDRDREANVCVFFLCVCVCIVKFPYWLSPTQLPFDFIQSSNTVSWTHTHTHIQVVFLSFLDAHLELGEIIFRSRWSYYYRSVCSVFLVILLIGLNSFSIFPIKSTIFESSRLKSSSSDVRFDYILAF